MKKIIIIILFFFSFFTNFYGQVFDSYLKKEILGNKKKGIESVLRNSISSSKSIVNIYNDLNIKTKQHRVKTFNQNDYMSLLECSKNDTLMRFWNENEKKSFGFENMVNDQYIKNHTISENEINGKLIYYFLSKPIYLKNENKMIFQMTKSFGLFQKIDSKIILMKKVKGKWKFFDEIYDLNEF